MEFIIQFIKNVMLLLGFVGGGNAFPKPLSAKEEKFYLEKYGYLKGKRLLRSSDALYLENMREREFCLGLEENSARALIEYLKKKEN